MKFKDLILKLLPKLSIPENYEYAYFYDSDEDKIIYPIKTKYYDFIIFRYCLTEKTPALYCAGLIIKRKLFKQIYIDLMLKHIVQLAQKYNYKTIVINNLSKNSIIYKFALKFGFIAKDTWLIKNI